MPLRRSSRTTSGSREAERDVREGARQRGDGIGSPARGAWVPPFRRGPTRGAGTLARWKLESRPRGRPRLATMACEAIDRWLRSECAAQDAAGGWEGESRRRACSYETACPDRLAGAKEAWPPRVRGTDRRAGASCRRSDAALSVPPSTRSVGKKRPGGPLHRVQATEKEVCVP